MPPLLRVLGEHDHPPQLPGRAFNQDSALIKGMRFLALLNYRHATSENSNVTPITLRTKLGRPESIPEGVLQGLWAGVAWLPAEAFCSEVHSRCRDRALLMEILP